METTATPTYTKYTFFWNGSFSNWKSSPFTIGGMKFTCEEQHMMYWKAITFEDHESATKIMETENPAIQKALGRQVKDFDHKTWHEVCQPIVYEGLKQKFLQNPELLKELAETKGTMLVEASPKDRVWGIGYGEWDAMEHQDDWGENILGKLLTKLRDEIC